jgi:3-hydroxy-9,10-secoandrosta-1,3,5(10)-triene-9,17-dione monooxygenase reductase component
VNAKTQMGPAPPASANGRSPATTHCAVDGAVTPDFRKLLSQFASGLVVLTVFVDGEPHGVTCQSFFSQSLEPPCVATSVSRRSSTLPYLRLAGSFGVNILAANQDALAMQFARKDVDRWAHVPWKLSAQGNPRLEGALAWMDCRIMTDVEAGDHAVLIGEVLDAAVLDPDADPLIYFRGAFHTSSQLVPGMHGDTRS